MSDGYEIIALHWHLHQPPTPAPLRLPPWGERTAAQNFSRDFLQKIIEIPQKVIEIPQKVIEILQKLT